MKRIECGVSPATGTPAIFAGDVSRRIGADGLDIESGSMKIAREALMQRVAHD